MLFTSLIGFQSPMQRWYEHNETLKQSIDLLQVFPDDILTVIAEGVNHVAEKEFKAKELMRDYKSLGQDKVLSLYKSKRRQRSYDKNPLMTTMVNYFLLISDDQRTTLASQVIELVNIVQEYLDQCYALQVKTDVEHIKTLRDQYLTKGQSLARETLEHICDDLKTQSKEGTFVRKFDESNDGLKLNFKRID